MIKWDDANKVLVDYMGIPLSRTAVVELRSRISQHLKKSAPDLAHVANTVIHGQGQSTDTKFSPETFQ